MSLVHIAIPIGIATFERLRQLSWEKDWRAQDIAREVHCDAGTVYNWLDRKVIALKRPRRTRRPKPYK